jgi:hypothetical protein
LILFFTLLSQFAFEDRNTSGAMRQGLISVIFALLFLVLWTSFGRAVRLLFNGRRNKSNGKIQEAPRLQQHQELQTTKIQTQTIAPVTTNG